MLPANHTGPWCGVRGRWEGAGCADASHRPSPCRNVRGCAAPEARLMAGRSSIERLPPAILAAVHEAIVEGATIDEIVRRIRERGGTCSRSAVVRYVKRARARLRRWREDKALASFRPDTPGGRKWCRAAGCLPKRSPAFARRSGVPGREAASGTRHAGSTVEKQVSARVPPVLGAPPRSVVSPPGRSSRTALGHFGPEWAGMGRPKNFSRAPGGRLPPTGDAAARWRRDRASTSIRAGPGRAARVARAERWRAGEEARTAGRRLLTRQPGNPADKATQANRPIPYSGNEGAAATSDRRLSPC